MKPGHSYRFGAGDSTTVRIIRFQRLHFRTYVVFETVYNGRVVGEARKVLKSYAEKNWIALTDTSG
jgi:hypothetical protein